MCLLIAADDAAPRPPRSTSTPAATTRLEQRYPNELEGLELYAKYCPTLEPLRSTPADAERALGAPLSEKSTKSVLWYERDSWNILVYVCPDNGSYPEGMAGEKIESIDFVPANSLAFGHVHFPGAFSKRHVVAADAAWDEYSDAHGLVYEVYTSKPPFGGRVVGDLNRISYRAPLQHIIELQRASINQMRKQSR
jgi:hypothetical protein